MMKTCNKQGSKMDNIGKKNYCASKKRNCIDTKAAGENGRREQNERNRTSLLHSETTTTK